VPAQRFRAAVPPAPARLRLTRALLAAAAACLIAAVPAGAQPVPGPGVIVDGPSPALTGNTALDSAIARDGSGAVVYLKQISGTPHVFLSALIGGVFQPPVQLDSGLPAAASQPSVAATNGGVLAVSFLNGGSLYAVNRTVIGGPLSRRLLAGAASSPALQMSTLGKAYIAFATPDGSGSDVRSAYWDGRSWALESAPLNASPGDVAGSGSGRPAVAAAGDGVGVVAWGEAGHVYTRRVWGTSPSVVFEQADAPLGGCSEVSADEPAIGAGGDSSYAAVAFHATLSCAGQQQSRVLVNRLRASRYDGVLPADGLGSGPAAEGADDPIVAVGEYGRGWVTSERTGTNNAFAVTLAANASPGPVMQVNSLPNATPPYPVPGIAGYSSTLIVWQHDPGASGNPDIRVRFATDGATLGTETVLPAPTPGASHADQGLTAYGNVAGEAAIAWVQNTAAGNEIAADLLYQPPGAPVPATSSKYSRTARPVFSWSPSSELWGPVRYAVTMDGAPLMQTTGTSAPPPAPLSQGPHSWTVTATNPAGLSSGTRRASVFVDSQPPAVSLLLTGKRLAGTALALHVTDTDAPPPLPRADASGIALALVDWGDHTNTVIVHRRDHAYRRPGRYRIKVVAFDRAGNATVTTLLIRIKAPPKPSPAGSKPKPKPKAKTPATKHAADAGGRS
jgi:hypothetical protein